MINSERLMKDKIESVACWVVVRKKCVGTYIKNIIFIINYF